MLVGCHGRSQRATWLDPTDRLRTDENQKRVGSSFPRCSILGNIVTYINGSDFRVHLIPVPFGASGLGGSKMKKPCKEWPSDILGVCLRNLFCLEFLRSPKKTC